MNALDSDFVFYVYGLSIEVTSANFFSEECDTLKLRTKNIYVDKLQKL